MVRIIGIDPGLRNTGWGVISQEGSKLTYIADGAISTLSDMSAKATKALEDGAGDIGKNDDNAAARIGEALLHMDSLAEISEGDHIPVPEKRRAAR